MINDPIRELRGRPLKCTFLNNSKTVKNFWTLVEQTLFEISRPFFLYQGKGAGPLNQGSKRVQSLFRISFYPQYFVTTYRSENVPLDNLNLITQLFRSKCYVIRDFRGQNDQSLTSYISKTTNILKSIIEQKLFRIMLSTICNFHFFAKRPHKGVTRGPLKYSLPNISKTIENFWTHVEQKMLRI